MAGNYPDAPGQWMQLHRDGTAGFKASGASTVVQLSATEMANLMTQSIQSNMGGYDRVGFIFPEIRDIAGVLVSNRGTSTSFTIETSTDSTNGLDGTWTTRATGLPTGNTMNRTTPRYERHAVNYPAVIGIRFYQPGEGGDYIWLRPIQVYGQVDPPSSPNRLRFWHPTLDQALDLNSDAAYLDWGNVPQGSSEDRTFRIKNESDTLTANNVVVQVSAWTDDATIPFAGQQSISKDGVNFAAQQTVTAIAPNGISDVLTIRRVAPSNAPLGVWWAALIAAANTWT